MNQNDNYIYVDEQGQPMADNYSDSFGQSLSPQPRISDRADLLDKVRPEEVVEMIRHKLMGEELINGEWKKLACLQHNSLTETGAWELSNLMLSASSRNVSVSSLKNEEIKPRLKQIVTAAMFKMLRNWKEYGIKGTDQYYYVKEILYTNTLVSLKQCQGGGIRRMITATRMENVNYKGDDSSQKSGWTDGLLRKK